MTAAKPADQVVADAEKAAESASSVHMAGQVHGAKIDASGPPYPVAVLRTGHAGAGTLTFDRWNEAVTVTEPRDALDVSQLSSG